MREVEDAGELPSWSGEAVPAVGDEAPASTVDLPQTAAGAAQSQPQPQTQPQAQPLPGRTAEAGGRRGGLAMGLLIGLLGGLLLAGIAGGAYWLGTRQGNETETATGAGDSESDTEAEAGADGDVASPSTEAEAGTETDSETETETTASTLQVEQVDEDPAAAPIGEVDGQLLLPDGFVPSDPNYESRIAQSNQYAVVRGGKVYLYGFSPSQEALDEAIAVTEGVMGPDGYVVERFVDPDATDGEGASIFVDDKVLFDFNSTELDPASLPILDLGVGLMLQNPTARMLIIARSDAVGSAEVNLQISQDRGDAVVDYWVSRGVERSRMTVDARGEADASEDDDAQVAALNRSVEFVVSDVDDGTDGG